MAALIYVVVAVAVAVGVGVGVCLDLDQDCRYILATKIKQQFHRCCLNNRVDVDAALEAFDGGHVVRLVAEE